MSLKLLPCTLYCFRVSVSTPIHKVYFYFLSFILKPYIRALQVQICVYQTRTAGQCLAIDLTSRVNMEDCSLSCIYRSMYAFTLHTFVICLVIHATDGSQLWQIDCQVNGIWLSKPALIDPDFGCHPRLPLSQGLFPRVQPITHPETQFLTNIRYMFHKEAYPDLLQLVCLLVEPSLKTRNLETTNSSF